jgi:hypothetical protein
MFEFSRIIEAKLYRVCKQKDRGEESGAVRLLLLINLLIIHDVPVSAPPKTKSIPQGCFSKIYENSFS